MCTNIPEIVINTEDNETKQLAPPCCLFKIRMKALRGKLKAGLVTGSIGVCSQSGAADGNPSLCLMMIMRMVMMIMIIK